MIIVLKEADFSADNIGKIEIPRELHPQTKGLLNVYTRFSTISEQANALDDVVLTLDKYGMLEHLNLVLMPSFAKTIEEAVYDYATRNQLGSVDGLALDESNAVYQTDGEIHLLSCNIPTKNLFIYAIKPSSVNKKYTVYSPTMQLNEGAIVGGSNAYCFRPSNTFNGERGWFPSTYPNEGETQVLNITELSGLINGSSTLNNMKFTRFVDKNGERTEDSGATIGDMVTSIYYPHYASSGYASDQRFRGFIIAFDGNVNPTSEQISEIKAKCDNLLSLL